MKRALCVLLLAACGGVIRSGPQTNRVAYPNGFARFEFELRDGLPNGRGRAWYPNGTLQSEGSYTDGGRNGRFWFFTEDGGFEHQAMFFNNAEVWRSTVVSDEPPADWSTQLPDLVKPEPQAATRVNPLPIPEWAMPSRDPRPYFSNLDRTSSLARGGVQLGLGDAGMLPFGAVTRLDAFAHYRFSKLGAYAQASQTKLELPNGMSLTGRQSFEVGGTYLRSLARIGDLSTRVGFLLPLGHDDSNGFLAGAAGAMQRPSDAAGSIPSSVALRTGTSFTRVQDRIVLQVDLGVDWLFGSDESGFDAMVRANGGVGFGSRTAILTLELDNTVRLSDTSQRLHSIGIGGTVSLARFWLSACLSIAQDARASISTSVGHDL